MFIDENYDIQYSPYTAGSGFSAHEQEEPTQTEQPYMRLLSRRVAAPRCGIKFEDLKQEDDLQSDVKQEDIKVKCQNEDAIQQYIKEEEESQRYLDEMMGREDRGAFAIAYWIRDGFKVHSSLVNKVDIKIEPESDSD